MFFLFLAWQTPQNITITEQKSPRFPLFHLCIIVKSTHSVVFLTHRDVPAHKQTHKELREHKHTHKPPDPNSAPPTGSSAHHPHLLGSGLQSIVGGRGESADGCESTCRIVRVGDDLACSSYRYDVNSVTHHSAEDGVVSCTTTMPIRKVVRNLGSQEFAVLVRGKQ